MKLKTKYLILLPTTTTLTAVENKIPIVSNLVKKTYYKNLLTINQ